MPLTADRMMRVMEFARDQFDRIASLRDHAKRMAEFASQTDNSQTLKQLIYDMQALLEQAWVGDPEKMRLFIREEERLHNSAKRNKRMAEYMRRYRAREKVILEDAQDLHQLNRAIKLSTMSYSNGPTEEIIKERDPELDNVTLDFVFEGVQAAFLTLPVGEDYLVADNIRQILKDYNPTDTDVTFWYNKLFEEGLVERGKYTGEFRPLL